MGFTCRCGYVKRFVAVNQSVHWYPTYVVDDLTLCSNPLSCKQSELTIRRVRLIWYRANYNFGTFRIRWFHSKRERPYLLLNGRRHRNVVVSWINVSHMPRPICRVLNLYLTFHGKSICGFNNVALEYTNEWTIKENHRGNTTLIQVRRGHRPSKFYPRDRTHLLWEGLRPSPLLVCIATSITD